jgi:predicted transcriptional regulator
MAETKPDLFVSEETEIEVNETTTGAIQRGIQAADDGQVFTGEEVREQIRQWISEFSTPARR